MRALKIIAAACVLTAGSFICPLSAHADDPCIGDAPGCPTFGHLVCQQIDAGLTSSQVADNAMAAYNLTRIMAASLVAGAIVKYCPSYEGQ
jgi:hypothetical protein